MRVLFITRKYPPQVGGMEKYSYNLIKYWPTEKQVIFLNMRQWHLTWWLPYVFLKTLLLVSKEKSFSTPSFDLVYLCDGLLSPLGHLLKKFTKLPVAVACHGLDVIYPHWWYQKPVIFALKKLDKLICVSRATLDECARRGAAREKMVFIPNGIEIKLKTQNSKLKTLTKSLKLNNFNINLDNKQILLTVGRLVKRKGVAWFCENVITKLPQNIIYFVVGTGSEKQHIQNIIKKRNLENRVFLLGKLSSQDLEKVYAISDIFVMPNQKVFGDMEGFGLVALEAANYGLPVVASNLEGISDAIKSNENGILVPTQQPLEFIRQINILLKDQEKKQALILRAQKYNFENFNWQKITRKYYLELKNLV
jgi:glycosyltransferase involved in cell wall biosynthesis